MSLPQKLDRLLLRAEELRHQLNTADGSQVGTLSRELAELDPLVAKVQDFRAAERARDEAEAMLGDPELKELAEAEAGARDGRAAIASLPRLRLLGPAPAPLERLKGLYRVQLLIKSDSREALAAAGEKLEALDAPPRLDRDPQNLL